MNNEIKNKEKNYNIPYETFEIDTSKVNKNNRMTTEQFLQYKKEHDKKDEELFSTLHSQAKRIKEGQKAINHELNNQEPLLDNLHNDMDRIEGKMIKQTNQLKNYLEKTSNSCLYWTIGIEFLILLLFALM
jgi:hypothetical protein